jgi:CAAX prenyl protease-like protein
LLPPNLIVPLTLYPVANFAAPVAYFLLYPEEIRLLPTLPLSATDKEEQATVIRLGINLPLAFYGLLLCSVILWLWFSQVAFSSAGFNIKGWVSGTLKGGYIGLSWAGIWLWLWLVLSNSKRLSREVPGYGANFAKQVIVCVVGAFSEELWRVVCIAALIASGYSAGFSVTAAALTFAVAFLGNGLERSILAGLEGLVFGLLFVWQRSFFAPFAAHLAVQAVYLWGVGQFSPEGERKSWMRGIRCPICKTQLSRFQIRMRDPFDCPSCHEQISVSDGYRRSIRLVGLSAYLMFAAATMVLLENQISDTLFILLVWPVVFGVGTSGLLLYQRVFPPQLQYGSPTFITLNLNRHRSNANDSENKRD